MASGRNQQIGGVVHRKFLEYLFPGIDVERIGLGKSIPTGVLDPVVDDRHLEANPLGHDGHTLAHMSGAENEERRIRKNRLHVNFHDTSAEKAAFFRVILGQIEAEQFGFLQAHDHQGLAADFRFGAAAADAAHLAPIFVDQHFGGVFSRRGTFSYHDGGKSAPAPASTQLNNIFVDIPGHTILIMPQEYGMPQGEPESATPLECGSLLPP